MGIKLSISNISWALENDQQVYEYLKNAGFQGLEIAPTRVFPNEPYNRKQEAREFASEIREKYGLIICSIQSIWYGRNERIFGTDKERQFLFDYTKRAIDFAEILGARNIVFGSPKNRCIRDGDDENIAIDFFRTLGDYAAEHGTVLAMEANPVIYGTNYINNTNDAVKLIKMVGSKGFKLNLDYGTIIYNEENIENINSFFEYVNHIHISEINLGLIEQRNGHKELIRILSNSSYDGYVSIEMKKQDDVREVFKTIDYIAGL